MDKFETFETEVTGWIKRHKLSVLLVGTALMVVTIVSLLIFLFAGTVGLNLVYEMEMNSNLGNQNTTLTMQHIVTDTEMNNWNTLIMPIFGFMVNWVTGFILVLIVGNITILLYFIIREAYRMKRNHNLMLALPENL